MIFFPFFNFFFHFFFNFFRLFFSSFRVEKCLLITKKINVKKPVSIRFIIILTLFTFVLNIYIYTKKTNLIYVLVLDKQHFYSYNKKTEIILGMYL